MSKCYIPLFYASFPYNKNSTGKHTGIFPVALKSIHLSTSIRFFDIESISPVMSSRIQRHNWLPFKEGIFQSFRFLRSKISLHKKHISPKGFTCEIYWTFVEKHFIYWNFCFEFYIYYLSNIISIIHQFVFVAYLYLYYSSNCIYVIYQIL